MQKGNNLFWKFKTQIGSWFSKRFDRLKSSNEPTLPSSVTLIIKRLVNLGIS